MNARPFAPPPCIIVPVYNAPKETEACLHAVLRETQSPYRIIVLDDASPDPTISPMLKRLAKEHPVLELYQQKQNLGFAANVNYGMALAEGDVVLLNSDTVVSSMWLDKLVACAYSIPNVATVTPLSNAAGAFSTPENNVINSIPKERSINAVAKDVARVAAPLPVIAPTGNGFCLYIRRDALDKLGLFDAETFPYVAEENDFCQRAVNAGLVNLVDTSCYIYHARSASFEGDKDEKLAIARKALDQRYPDYKRQVSRFLDSPELEACRMRLRNALSRKRAFNPSGKPRILSVIHDSGGGMVHTNRDLMGALLDSFDTYELQCGMDQWKLIRIADDHIVSQWRFGSRWRSGEAPDVPRRLALRSLGDVLNFNLVHVRTLIGTGPEILANLANVVPAILFSFHDFATVCPTIQLLDEKLQFCGGHCTPGKGECPVHFGWFGDIHDLKHAGVHRWRERMGSNIPLADAFVTTSESAKKLIVDHFPVLGNRRFAIIEHGRDKGSHGNVAVPPGSPLRVVVPGALSPAKGSRLLEALFEASTNSNYPVEFHLLGNLASDFHYDFPNVICHGPYVREELPTFLERIAPSYAMICSIWPETYCHTLTESWMSGLPVLASDIGVLKERVQRHGGGRLINPHRPELWLQALHELRNPETWRKLHDQVQKIQIPSIQSMADKYTNLYRSVLE